MTRAAWALVMASLVGCSADGLQPDKSWLAGEWMMMDGVLEYPLACGAHGPITYRPDGTYFMWGEAGTWRLDGNVLTETMTGFDEMHVDRSPADVGKPYVSKLLWNNRDRFQKRFANGSVAEFRLCPARD